MTRRRRRLAAPVLLLSVAAVVSGCASGRAGTDGAAGTGSAELVVFAASSFAAPLGELVDRFQRDRPGVEVRINPASSTALALQIADGAPAGVFASAGRAPIERAGGRVVDPVVVATDDLVVAVPEGNPGRVRVTADLARVDLRVGACPAGVPCGDYARRVFDESGVVPAVDTEEPDAASLLAKVRSGDLDAAVLYRSQVAAAAPMVESVQLDPPSRVRAEYVVTALRSPDGSPPSPTATAFVEFVTATGAGALREAGFGPP